MTVRKVTISLPGKLLTQVDAIAKAETRSRSQQIAHLIGVALPAAPEIDLPKGVGEDRHEGPTWYLNLPDGRVLRLAEHYEGEFAVERCDVKQIPGLDVPAEPEEPDSDGRVVRRG